MLLLKRIILAKVSNNSTYTSIHSDHNAVKLASCIFQCLEHNINRINKKFLVDDENYDNLKLICFEQAEVILFVNEYCEFHILCILIKRN